MGPLYNDKPLETNVTCRKENGEESEGGTRNLDKFHEDTSGRPNGGADETDIVTNSSGGTHTRLTVIATGHDQSGEALDIHLSNRKHLGLLLLSKNTKFLEPK